MANSRDVIAKFGGVSELARLLDKPRSTVQHWAEAGIIPARWQSKLLDLAISSGIAIEASDFITPSDTSADILAQQDVAQRDDEVDDVQDEVPAEDVSRHRLPLPRVRWPGVLRIGAVELPVYVLDDGRRIISRTGATTVIAGGKNRTGDLESYIGVEALKGYIPEDLNMIEFDMPGVVGKTSLGLTAEAFLEICTAYVRALDDSALKTPRQRAIAIKAGMFLASCSKVGLIALIDEATGYQDVREEDALQFKLRLFLEEEMRKWESTFPEELWREFGRLTHWKGPINQRPKYWGKLVMELVYGYLDADVADWLRHNNPEPRKGRNHHQWLSGQYGLKRLMEHIWMLIGMARYCGSMPELKRKMAENFGRQPVQFTLWLPPHQDEPKQTLKTAKVSARSQTDFEPLKFDI